MGATQRCVYDMAWRAEIIGSWERPCYGAWREVYVVSTDAFAKEAGAI